MHVEITEFNPFIQLTFRTIEDRLRTIYRYGVYELEMRVNEMIVTLVTEYEAGASKRISTSMLESKIQRLAQRWLHAKQAATIISEASWPVAANLKSTATCSYN